METRIQFMDIISGAGAVNKLIFFKGCHQIAACTHLGKLRCLLRHPPTLGAWRSIFKQRRNLLQDLIDSDVLINRDVPFIVNYIYGFFG